MPSAALTNWSTAAQTALDELETAHRAVGGQGPGRRYATQQINHAYAVLLSSQFQGFCRALHTEAVDFLIASSADPWVKPLLRPLLLRRKLDRGNPTPDNLAEDFFAFGMRLWDDVQIADPLAARRTQALRELNRWRNAIAHQDWTAIGPTLQLADVRRWRRACMRLAVAFDHVTDRRLRLLVGTTPW